MKLNIKEHLPWILLFLAFLLAGVAGTVFLMEMFTPSSHDYSSDKTIEETTEEEEKTGTYYVYGGAHGLPFSSEPSQYAEILNVIPNKTPVEIVSGLKRGYYKIRYQNQEGYVKSIYLLRADQSADDEVKTQLKEDYPLYYVTNCKESANLYKKQDASSKVVTKVPKGYQVRALSVSRKGYCRVAYKNKTGYIPAEYLSKSKE